MLKKYSPHHGENRMSHEGDTVSARERFLAAKNKNVQFLIKNRYEWMNDFISDNDEGVEVGAGTGVSKIFIKDTKKYLITDFTENNWLDVTNVDALNTPFKDGEFDFVVSSNMIHHVPYPLQFFEEMSRILKPGGTLLIQEINASLVTRIILRVMRHEGYDTSANVFDRNEICTNPEDLWSANCVIPNLLFDDEDKFHRNVPYFKMIHSSYSECLMFLNSGGVIAQTFYVPLPNWALVIINKIDNILTYLFPSIFAMQRQIVLKKLDEGEKPTTSAQ